MNIEQYKTLKASELEALRTVDTLYVSKQTLFKKKEFRGLSEEECWDKAIELGWRWDLAMGKFYRSIGY